MDLGQSAAGLLGIAFLIGGPWWLISNAIERRRARRAVALAAREAAAIDHVAITDIRMDAIGPLSEAELLVLLRLTLWVTSMNGAATWQEISLQAAMARRIVRENPDGWPEKRGDNPKQPLPDGDETPGST
jgi:hypothetical protein